MEFTVKDLYALANKIPNNIQSCTKNEIAFIQDLVITAAKKAKLAQRKNLNKYIDHYVTEMKGDANRNTVGDLLHSLDVLVLDALFKKLDGNVVYRDFKEFLVNCEQGISIAELRMTLV